MPKFYALTDVSGHIAIMQLVDGADLNEAVRKFAAVTFEPVSVDMIDPNQIPQDRTYRNAWRKNGAKIEHDMPAARELHRDKLRIARKPMLAALDVEVSKALARGDDAKAIEAQRQRLRDAPANPRIEAAQTVDALKAVTL